MNDTEVLEMLSHRFEQVRYDEPVEAVVRRGRALRRRRRAPAAIAGVLAVTGGLLVVGSHIHGDTAFASWTSQPQASDAATVATIDTSCREMAESVPGVLPPLRIVDRRGDFAFSLYTDGRSAFTCELFQGANNSKSTWRQGGGSFSEELGAETVNSDNPVAVDATGQVSVTNVRGRATTVYGRYAETVDKIVVDSPAAMATAKLHRGAFTAWWPDGGQAGGLATIRAYDSSGALLTRTVTPLPAP